MTDIRVAYQPALADDTKEDVYTLDIATCDSVICELKRQIFARHGVIPILQRLQLEGDSDNFSIPTRVICKVKNDRNANKSVTVYGFNEDNYMFGVDIKNDNICDIKFLLGQCIKEKAEYIELSVNRKLMFSDNISVSSLVANGDLVLDGNNPKSMKCVRYWLEYPSSESGHGTVHQTLPYLLDVDPEYPTIPALLRKMARLSMNDNHLGTRPRVSEDKLGPFEWITFGEVNSRVSLIAAGFRSLGLGAGTRMGLCALNRKEWVLSDYAGHTQSFVTVPLYSTLGSNVIEYIINHASIEIVCCSADKLGSIVAVSDKCKSLKYIVLMDEPDTVNSVTDVIGYTHTLSQICLLGASNPVCDVLPNADSLATICYTSGTTGLPKGVMLSHRNLMSAVNAFLIRLPSGYMSGNEDSVLSYLPLSHIYERVVELLCLRTGGRVGYFGGSTDNLLDDIQALQPTVLVGVPRVFEKIKDRTMAEVGKSNVIRRFLFNQALAAKQSAVKQGLQAPAFWEKLVISKVRAKFGGKLKGCISGSAPLSARTGEFMKALLSDMVGEGYGLTETSAAGTSTDIEECDFGNVGQPVASVQIKLVSVADMNYLVTDLPLPRGEIWIKGNSVFCGYYLNPEKTKQVMSSDGWFATGDVGQWTENGNLQIIDRKKNLFKLAQGEYVRPEYIENVLKMSKYVGNAFVYGHSSSTHLVAIIVPDFESILSSEFGNENEEICRNDKLYALVRSDIDRVCKREQLMGFEKVKRFVLYPNEFTVDNGLLTSTFKLKRHFARKFFEKEIDILYKTHAKSKL